MTDGLLSLFYPEDCFICTHPVAGHRDCSVCDGCWQKVVALQVARPWCVSCNLPFQSPETDCERLCGRCSARMPPYSGARSYGYYEAELRHLIQGFKFQGRRNLVSLLAPLLAGAFRETWRPQEFDCLVPVPLHRSRQRERGYNQSALLARALEPHLGLACSEPALSRTRATRPQVGLTDAERRRNLDDAFRCRSPEAVFRKRLLLIDDVMTTGATVESATLALRNAGALRVSVLTVARAAPGR